MKIDLFQSCGHCWVFQTCWHIKCSTFTASSSRVWNSSTGIPLPPLALSLEMLSTAHLTLNSGCLTLGKWSHHRDYLGCKDLFCSFSVYSCHLLLISSASVRFILFPSFIMPIFRWNVSLVSLIFLKRFFSLSHSIVSDLNVGYSCLGYSTKWEHLIIFTSLQKWSLFSESENFLSLPHISIFLKSCLHL